MIIRARTLTALLASSIAGILIGGIAAVAISRDGVFRDVASIAQETLLENSPEPCRLGCFEKAQSQYKEAFGSLLVVGNNVQGRELRGSAEELSILKEMLGKRPPSTWRSIPASCSTVVCVLSSIFRDEESAYRALTLAKTYGYFMSLDQSLMTSREGIFSGSELLVIESVLEALPKSFHRLSTLKQFKFSQSGNCKRTGVAGLADAGTRSMVICVKMSAHGYIHELAHMWDSGRAEEKFPNKVERLPGESESKYALRVLRAGLKNHRKFGTTFSSRSGFEEISWNSKKNPEPLFGTAYAASMPTEDFAEAVALYVDRPEILKTCDPVKYEHLRERVFDGLEYRGHGYVWDHADCLKRRNGKLVRVGL
jgi:hypothetical protein